jgi:hypothetical protein
MPNACGRTWAGSLPLACPTIWGCPHCWAVDYLLEVLMGDDRKSTESLDEPLQAADLMVFGLLPDPAAPARSMGGQSPLENLVGQAAYFKVTFAINFPYLRSCVPIRVGTTMDLHLWFHTWTGGPSVVFSCMSGGLGVAFLWLPGGLRVAFFGQFREDEPISHGFCKPCKATVGRPEWPAAKYLYQSICKQSVLLIESKKEQSRWGTYDRLWATLRWTFQSPRRPGETPGVLGGIGDGNVTWPCRCPTPRRPLVTCRGS